MQTPATTSLETQPSPPIHVSCTDRRRFTPRSFLKKHGSIHEFDASAVTHAKKKQGATFSEHAVQRARQRRITHRHVDACRAMGTVEFEQGFKGVRVLHRYHGLCVVSCARTGHVITQWWENEDEAEEAAFAKNAKPTRHAHVRAMRQAEKQAFYHGEATVC